jgi:hypothetical protein
MIYRNLFALLAIIFLLIFGASSVILILDLIGMSPF